MGCGLTVEAMSSAQFPYDRDTMTGFVIGNERPLKRQVLVIVAGVVKRSCGRWRAGMRAEVRGGEFYVDGKLVHAEPHRR